MLKWKLTSSAITGLISLNFVIVLEIKQQLQLLIPPFLPSSKIFKLSCGFILFVFWFAWAGSKGAGEEHLGRHRGRQILPH